MTDMLTLDEMGEQEERLIIELHHGDEPIALLNLTDSLAALAAFYERHYRAEGEAAPKLFVTRLSSGSVIAEIAPYAEFFGQAMTAASYSVTVANFTHRLVAGIKAFVDPAKRLALPPAAGDAPDREDTKQLREFLKPLAGKTGAKLGIRNARFFKADGEKVIFAEYSFDEGEINRAAVNMDRVLESSDPDQPSKAMKPYTEVMLFFDSASRGPGKETGRTRDYAVVPEASDRPLPVHFRSGVDGSLKDVMVRGAVNPLTDVAYIVDVHAQLIDDEPRGYIVTRVHRTVPLPDKGG